MAADTTSLYKKPRKEKVAELMLAMEIEKRRKRSLEVENKNTEEDTEREGDWFDVRQILLDIKNTKKRPKLDPVMVEEYIKSKPCTKEKSKPVENQVNSETRKFSNRWKDAVKVICQICGRSENCNVLRSHTRKIHGISITEYKQQFGALSDHYVERVYHECGECGKVLLLDPDVIAPHARSHGMTHAEYTAKHIILNKEAKRG